MNTSPKISRRGQTSVEYMLVISVLVIAVVVGMNVFNRTFPRAMRKLGRGAETVYTDASIAAP